MTIANRGQKADDPLTRRGRRAKTRRKVVKRSDAAGSPPGDRAEVISLLWERARAGSVTAAMVLLREMNREDSGGKGRPTTAIDELASRRKE
jgi:hypothetical protein